MHAKGLYDACEVRPGGSLRCSQLVTVTVPLTVKVTVIVTVKVIAIVMVTVTMKVTLTALPSKCVTATVLHSQLQNYSATCSLQLQRQL